MIYVPQGCPDAISIVTVTYSTYYDRSFMLYKVYSSEEKITVPIGI